MFHEFHLMIKFLSECGKGPKKTFAPPAQKLQSLMLCSSDSPKEETLGISSPEAEARPDLPKARSRKKEKKATTENGPSSGQGEKRKSQDNRQAEKKDKVLVTLMSSSGTVSPSRSALTNRIFTFWGNSSCTFKLFIPFLGLPFSFQRGQKCFDESI